MNDNFSFDGAAAADMPLDLSSSSMPEVEAATGFHLPEMTPAQEQAKADSPKLVDEWRQDVQMLDDGGLNGLEERAGLEAGVSLDAEAAEEEGSESFNPQLGDMDSVRRKGSMLMKGVEERKREQARDRQNMVMNLLRAGRNDQEALKRIAERWGEDAVSRLESANEEERAYMLGMRLAEVLGDGDSDAGFQIYKNTHDLWGKGIVSPEQVWKDFRERGKDIVEREDRQRVERERRISDLNGVVSRYVSGEQDSLSADERMALFHAGVSVASMEKARRGVRLMEAFEQDSRLYHDDIADDLFGIIGNDDDALMMLCNLLRNRSRSTAHDRLGMGGAEKRADEAYQEVMENSNPMVVAMAGPQIQNAKMASGLFMTGKVAGVKTKRSLERALQNMRSHEDARMKAAALQVSVAKARQMGLSDAEAFELAGVQEQERRELQQKRSRIFSALTTALEGGEDDYFSSDEASSLSKVGYHLGSMTGDTAPWFLPYAGPLIGLNTSMQRRREEGYMLGLDVDEIEKRAFWFGAADAAEEMIGFHGLFRATPLYKGVRKLLRTKKGAGVRAQVSGSPAAQYALQGVVGTVEEGILEPTAGYLMRSTINPMLDDERGKQTWDQYASELSQMTSGEQGLALLAFSFGLSGLNYSQLSRAAREFRLSLKNYEALGGTAQGYLEAREEKTAEGFLNKALSNLHDSWMEDPQSSLERASAAAGERLSGERIESLRELDAWRAAEDAGMVPRVEPAEQEGMFRVYAPARSTKAPREDASVSREGQEENAPSYTLMDGEQMTAYLQAFVSEQVESDILYTQHLLAGDVTVSQALAQGRFDAAEVITRTVTDEQTGAERVVIAPETLGQMKARADMAMAAIRALEAEGVSYEDAAARMDASLSEHLPLGTLVKTWEEAQERIRTEQARTPEFKVPAMDAPFSNAYVTKVRRGDTFRRVLRYARGNATVEDLMEETMEQAVISWQAEQGLTWGEFGAMLQEAQRVMNDLFPEARGEEMQFIHLDAGKPVTDHDAIEAFSKIGRSRWLADAVNHPSLPSWLRKLLNHLVKFLGAFKARVELGEMVRQAEEQGVFTLPVRQALAVMLDAGNALYRDQQGDLMELSMERARAQAELDAMFGAGVATEARTLEDELAESRKEDEERRKEAEDEARAPENSPEAQEARREREQARVEALGEEYGEQKVYRLISKFMARVVEQIDRFRKDRTLGRIRRVAASVAPRTSPQGKPLRGKMDAESYRRLEDRLRLMEMTPAQYDAFFRKNFPEVLDEEAAGQQEGRTLWEDVKPQDPVTVETTDAEGGALALTVTKATFEAYACYEKMSVETAENAARALGEFIATRREAWENAAESKKNEIEDLLRPVLEAAGRTDDQAMATHRKQARLKTLPSGPMSLTGYLLNFSQYMQGLQSVPAFRGIAKKFERRAARFAVQKQACEKDTLAFVKKAAGRILQTEDEYEIADWIYEQRGGLDTGLTITEQEPDWQGKAREEYRAGVLNLIRRKVRKRGAARTLAHVAFLMKDMDAELKAEIERVWPDARDEVWSEKDAAVFTEKELDRYGSQKKYVEEHAARARKASKWGKGKSPYQAQSYKLDHISRMEAAYIILLSQQEDYQEMLRLKGFTQDVLEALEQFAGSEVMEFSRALREKLNERGQEVKEVTESRYGAPFPMIENYFRAFFDVGIEAIDQSIMDAASYGDAATGGKFGLIHARKKHHASLDLSIDVLTAYYAAMNEQDVYLYGSEISRDMRALINYRGENGTRGARVLEKVIGRDALNKLLVWCDSFDKGMAGNVRGFLEMQKSLNRISSAAAITLLPGRVGTWLKQSTALINAAFSSDEIDPHEWAASMARMAAGKLALSPRELMKRAALDARDATETAVIREAMSADEAGRAASGAWKRLNVKGMNLLTQTDVGLNAVSSAILYDAVYRKEMKRNPGLSREEADRRAMMEVELSLSRKAQPMTPQQRSLAAQTRSVWNVGMLFLGGESINTFAETVALWKQGGMKNKAKSVSMFYAHGLLLAAMSAMLNFFTDDERRRKRREWWHIFIDALQGPLQGIPFWGALAGGAVRGMSSLCGYRYYEATTSLVPFASWDNLERAGKDLAKLFDGKDKDWVDFPLAFMGALRMAAFGAALGGASTPKVARFKAAAFSAAAFVNLTEFLLRAMKGLPLRLDGK